VYGKNYAIRGGAAGRERLRILAIGADMDETKLDIARREADALGIRNVEFRYLYIRSTENDISSVFDVVYARFLLTHLDDPSRAVAAFYHYLRPGGLVIVEDIDFNGHFTYPESKAFQRYRELYCEVVQKRGGDPNIGPRLPILLADGGLEKVEMTIVQPAGLEGEVKVHDRHHLGKHR